MNIRPEVKPFILLSLGCGVLAGGITVILDASLSAAITAGSSISLFLCSYFLYFFRDPDRQPPVEDVTAIVAGADGTVAAITELREDKYLHTDCIRISIFLSLFDVHVNRAPFAGQSRYLGYFPGKHFFTFQEKSSDVNQHNKIFIEGQYTRCLITQIVGPVCRRVVYWPDHDKAVDLKMGAKIGMMKFGSRLDMYFPKSDIMVEIRQEARVRAGETVIGHATADQLNQKGENGTKQ